MMSTPACQIERFVVCPSIERIFYLPEYHGKCCHLWATDTANRAYNPLAGRNPAPQEYNRALR
jgi:hypothetical protein